ncbi:ArsR family transcriptional regulator [Knoellia remsis]|uniref:ArsR family transcriptional regulator n=1 Tax=Knoellia remsis TaxID=407159 RepID=A0A2T0UJV7_9MICO|nr:helix-turn-helix domain-containing protein [Knoellia remsis]PRY58229.1 ArsR family transcriptional regulator [Knoellia remsis]
MPRSRRRSTLTIDDPKALRALAHPARQRVINELYNGEVLTATEAARLCDLTPSAMSYHLRALEKWGIVERDEDSGDGRERPWRAVADNITVSGTAHAAAGVAASSTFLVPWADEVRQGLERAARTLAHDIPDKRTQMSRGRLWLTAEEAKELDKELRAVLQPYKKRTLKNHPEGAVPRDGYWMLLPPPGSDV